MSDPEEILNRQLIDQEEAQTVGGFLAKLLAALWDEGEGFSSKRPLGNSDWESVLDDVATAAEIHDAILSLSRDKTPVEQMIEDAEQVRYPTTLTSDVAEALVGKGWVKK